MEAPVGKIRSCRYFTDEPSIEPIRAGSVNSAFKVTCNGKLYMAKLIPVSDVGQSPRQAIFDVQLQLSKLGFAVEPLFYNPSEGVWIEAWCTLPIYRSEEVQEPDVLENLARMQANIHGLQVNAPAMDVIGLWQKYLQHEALANNDAVRMQVSSLSNKMKKFAHTDSVFCHNDLSLGHLCQAPNTIVFDWEYAGFGNRYFDVASTILINQLDTQQTHAFLDHYAHFSGIQSNTVRHSVDRITPCVSLTYLLWMMTVPHTENVTEN